LREARAEAQLVRLHHQWSQLDAGIDEHRRFAVVPLDANLVDVNGAKRAVHPDPDRALRAQADVERAVDVADQNVDGRVHRVGIAAASAHTFQQARGDGVSPVV
jgi:hypothetical protein